MISKIIRLLSLVTVISNITYAQNIRNKAELGVYVEFKNDSTSYYEITSVNENSTAEIIGLMAGDRISSLNGISLNNEQSLYTELAKYFEGDSVSVKVTRNHKSTILKGRFIATKVSSVLFERQIIKEVSFDGGFSRAFINKPSNDSSKAIIIFLQGYTCQSIDWKNEKNVFMRTIHNWTSNGFTVVRFEKPGTGNYLNQTPCEDYGFNYEQSFYQSALSQLYTWKEVNTNKIILYGHSLGGIHAPLLANSTPVDAIMTYGTVSRPWMDYLLALPVIQGNILNPDIDLDYSNELKTAEKALNKVFNQAFNDLSSLSEEEISSLKKLYQVDENYRLFGRSKDFWAELSKIRPLEYWKKIQSPVLSMYGSSDLAALNEQDAINIIKEVQDINPNFSKFELINNADHSLVEVPSKRASVALKWSGQYKSYYEKGPSPEFLKTTLNFLKSII